MKYIKRGLAGISIVGISYFLAYLFHFLVTRLLSVGEYGDLSVIMGLTFLFYISANSFVTELTRKIAKKLNKAKEYLHGYKNFVLKIGTFASFVLIIIGIFGYFFTKLKRLSLGLIFSSAFPPIVYSYSLLKGYFQGLENIKKLAIIWILEPAIRIMIVFLLIEIGLGVVGGAISLWIGMFIILIMFFESFKGKEKIKIKIDKRIFYILMTNLFIITCAYLDLFFVRFMISDKAAGYYNVAGLIAKILFLGTDGLVMTLLPKSSKLTFKERAKMGEMLLMSIGILLLGLSTFLTFPKQIILFFFPAIYINSVKPFMILSISMFSLGVTILLFNLFWSQHLEKITFKLSIIGMLLQPTILSILIPKFGMIGAAFSSLITFSTLMVISYISFNKISTKKLGKPSLT